VLSRISSESPFRDAYTPMTQCLGKEITWASLYFRDPRRLKCWHGDCGSSVFSGRLEFESLLER
jgi:hypothetical protein